MSANSVSFPGFLWTLLALMVVIPCSVKPSWWEYRAWGFNFDCLGAPKCICTAVLHKTALAGKGCCSLAGPVERSL